MDGELVTRPARAWLLTDQNGGDDSDGGSRVERLSVDLEYDPADPWAVTVIVDGVAFVFGRDALAAALDGAEPDPAAAVRIAVNPVYALIELPTDDDTPLSLSLRPGRLRQFLGATYKAVPAGHEGDRIDWDGELSRLLEVDQ